MNSGSRPGQNRWIRSWGKKVAQGAILLYLDEVGFSPKGVRRRTWSTRVCATESDDSSTHGRVTLNG
ncbi:hypothetical protein DGo_PB0058 (plasmid) [Deinococcus gobiensis I-0]|uniref:Transposase n=1 Tax=Deinococcus gobiensis (strain DSM 21396 / JCM 16679 / CGMCC 1.7299 / I-0) TaxID=745776 RepID=H8H1D0_DEIGI|nr:hypothetical protein DGo_PB0058 [Deinococcus gobiensis I-0]